jgi:hypothetical protein
LQLWMKSSERSKKRIRIGFDKSTWRTLLRKQVLPIFTNPITR